MRISYDPEVDALYIRLLEGEYQCRTVRLSETVSLNMGPAEQLVGIEVLDASRTVKLDPSKAVDLENLKPRLAS